MEPTRRCHLVRFGAHVGLKSDIAPCPKSANSCHQPTLIGQLRLTRIVTRSRRYQPDSDQEPPAKVQLIAARTASARRPSWRPPQYFRVLSTNDMHRTVMR